MGERLYRYCWTIFLAWLSVFLLLVLVCLRSTGWQVPKRAQPVVAETIPIAVEQPPQVLPEPKPEPKPAPAPVYEPLAVGSLPGEGTLGKPEFSGNKLVQEIRIPYTGTLGEYRTFTPQNVASRSFNIQGKWKFASVAKQYVNLPNYPIKLFQMANHDGFARLSLVFHDKYNQKAEVFNAGEHILIRLTAITAGQESKDTGPKRLNQGAKDRNPPAPQPVQAEKGAKDTAPPAKKAVQRSATGNASAPASQQPAKTPSVGKE